MLVPLLLLALQNFAAATTAPNHVCADYLGVPVQFADKFRAYTDTKFISPMGHRHGEDNVWGFNLVLKTRSDEFTPRPRLSARLFYGFAADDPDVIDVAEVHIPQSLAPEFTYRMLFAHLLDRWPRVNSINIFVFNGPEHGTVRERLAKGVPIDEAIKDTPVYLALEAFDFRLASAKAPVHAPDEQMMEGETLIELKMIRSPAAPLSR